MKTFIYSLIIILGLGFASCKTKRSMYETAPTEAIGCGVTHEDEVEAIKKRGLTVTDVNWSKGPKKLLDMQVDFPDLPLTSGTQDLANLQMAAAIYRTVSSGTTDLIPTVTTKRYMMPHPSTYYATKARQDANSALMTDATALVSKDYNLDSFDRIMLHFPGLNKVTGSQIKYGGWSDIAGKRSWMNGQFSPRLLVHEIGHTYGCHHADLWKAKDTTNYITPPLVEYGDRFDYMGGDWSQNPNLDFNPWFKQHLGWPIAVQNVTASGKYRVFEFDTQNTNTPQTLVVMRTLKDGCGEKMLINLHAKYSPNSAYIITGYLSNSATGLVDAIPGTDSTDGLWPIGKSLNDGGLSITVVGSGGIAPNRYIDVQINIK